MLLALKDELVWHSTVRIRNLFCLGSGWQLCLDLWRRVNCKIIFPMGVRIMNEIVLPTENAIITAAKKLDAAASQVVAEMFFAIRHGMSINPIGRNPDGQTIKGYPDIIGRVPGEKKYLIEVTKDDWRTHIKSDLSKLPRLQKGAYAGFRLLCFRKSESELPQSNRKKVRETVQQAETRIEKLLGVEAGKVEFVFLGEFAHEVRSAKYHRVLMALGLELVPAPFYTDLRFVQGLADFVPTAEEYEAESVVPRDEVSGTYERVFKNRITLIEGDGGSGKTSLALAVATEHRKRGEIFLFLDASVTDWKNGSERARLVEVAAMFAESNALIILDNVHLGDASGISELVTNIQASGYDFRFLLTTRSSDDVGHWRRLGDIELLRRVPTGDDVSAAYNRLLAQRFPGAKFNEIPPAVTTRWSNQIPNLVILTLALGGLTKRGGYDRDWAIKVEDAGTYLQAKFLSKLSSDDVEQVGKIAALSLLEIPTSLKSLDNRVPKSAVDLGFVRLNSSSTTQRYELVHHELGKLITSFKDPDIKARLGEVMRADPFQATYIGVKLIGMGQNSLAKELLSSVLSEALTLSPDFSMGNSGGVFGSLVQSNVTTYSEIERILLPDIGVFFDTKPDIVTGLSSFLGATSENMPRVYDAILEKLKEQETIRKIEDRLPSVGPTTFATLYRCASSRGLPLLSTLRKYLNKGNRIDSFAFRCGSESPSKVEICCGLIDEFFLHHKARFEVSLRSALSERYIERLIPEELIECRSSRAVQTALVSTNSEVFNRYITFRGCSDETLLRLTQMMHDIGRDDLSEVAADRVAGRTISSIWYNRRTGGRALLAVLRRASKSAEGDIEKILMRLEADGKMRAILNGMRPYRLANFVFVILDRHTKFAPFISDTDLKDITKRRFRARAAEFSEERQASIYVAGVYALAGLDIPRDEWSMVDVTDDDLKGNQNNPVFWIGLKALEENGMIRLANRSSFPTSVGALLTHSADIGRIMHDLKKWAAAG